MRQMNGSVVLDGRDPHAVADEFLRRAKLKQ
jgi:glycine betaine/choline ABC-type transport system substrate-binding protein